MDDRFDQEFYRSVWQRVLPLAPGGIQPYVRTARSRRFPGLPGSARPLARLRAAARSALRRFALGLAERPWLPGAGPGLPRGRSLRLVHATTRPTARQAPTPRHASKAA